jgi:integrase
VYGGKDVVTGRDLYLKQTIPAGPDAWAVAERVRDELVCQVEQGRQPRTNATLGQLVDVHLSNVDMERRAKQTLQGYARKHIHAQPIGERTINEVDAQVLETFYAELRRCRDHCDGRPTVRHYTPAAHRCTRRCTRHVCRPLAKWTVRKIHFLISAAYQRAIRWKWVDTNPTRQAEVVAAPTPDPNPPTAEQAAALVNECWRWGDLGPYVWLAMTTGARRGELCALRWEHLQAIHADRGSHDCLAAGCRWVLVVRRAIGQSIGDGETWEKDTKTHQRRHIAVDPETVAVLAEHRERCTKAARDAGFTLSDSHYVFAATPDGGAARKPSTMSNRYKTCAKRLSIATCLKNLRHYSATELITAGVDIRTVAGRLGHSGGGTTTLKVYAAWVAAADQHASIALMNRMPNRPTTALPGAVGAIVELRKVHEQLAADMYTEWRSGALAPGTEVTVKGLARSRDVTEYAAHRAITHLKDRGVLEVRNGHRSIVLPCDEPHPTTAADMPPHSAVPGNLATSQPEVPDISSEGSTPGLVTLDLMHLGTSVRTMITRADPTNFDILERLLRAAVRRVGGDPNDLIDYELVVHVPGQHEPVTTVVVAA